jgi:hypothetical protein
LDQGEDHNVFTVPRTDAPGDNADAHAVCVVCGTVIENEADIEDSNGWRWFSDGRGGLLPLCPTCPVPAEITKGQA